MKPQYFTGEMFELIEVTFNSIQYLVVVAFVLFYLYLKTAIYSYWKEHGIPQEDTIVPSGIFGISFLTKKITLGNLLKNSYSKFKKYPYHGLYMLHNPILMINDPELIKTILIKDFAYFCDRGLYCNSEIDPLSANLFCLGGDKWRTLRAKLTPTFTPGKIKHMFSILKDVAEEMIQVTDEELSKTNIIEIKDLIARFATDGIFTLAFGLQSNCLREGNNQFRYHGKLAVENNFFRLAVGFFAPKVLDFFRTPLTPPAVTNFFIKLFGDMVQKRRTDKIQRKDVLDSLIDLMDHEQLVDSSILGSSNGISAEKIVRKLEHYEAAAQAFLFILVGFETSSSVAIHCMYELALNPEIQEKLQEEIDGFLKNSKDFEFEDFSTLKYLDMVFCEAARKHPILPFLNRICVEDYKMPSSDYILPKGTGLVISVTGLHYDPNIYSEPNKFDPLRFSNNNMSSDNINLSFGLGPRTCIGKRLGALQSKIVIFYLLANYTFSVCDKTPIPAEYSADTIVQTPRDGFYLKAEKRRTNGLKC